MPSAKRIQKNKKAEKFERAIVGLVFVFGVYLMGPAVVHAVIDLGPRWRTGEELSFEIAAMQNELTPFGTLPEASDGSPARMLTLPVTAYSSDIAQTDTTPTITASGTTVRHGVVAANFLPLGTRVKFPELYGHEVFIVEDRMHDRFNKRLDVWMEERADAQNFGLQWTTVEVF